MGGHARGVAQIKTLSSIRASGIHSNERHVHQFQIAALELERSRCARERQAGLNRIKTLDDRLCEIELQIRKHQAALNVTNAHDAACNTPTPKNHAAANEKRRTIRY